MWARLALAVVTLAGALVAIEIRPWPILGLAHVLGLGNEGESYVLAALGAMASVAGVVGLACLGLWLAAPVRQRNEAREYIAESESASSGVVVRTKQSVGVTQHGPEAGRRWWVARLYNAEVTNQSAKTAVLEFKAHFHDGQTVELTESGASGVTRASVALQSGENRLLNLTGSRYLEEGQVAPKFSRLVVTNSGALPTKSVELPPEPGSVAL
jgi:hypothetical protein